MVLRVHERGMHCVQNFEKTENVKEILGTMEIWGNLRKKDIVTSVNVRVKREKPTRCN